MNAAERPLAGRTIVVTRAREQASHLSSKLRGLGATVVEIPTIAIVPPDSFAPLDQALAELDAYDWLIVTSANAARVLGERRALLAVRPGTRPSVAAIGPATALALEGAGFRVDLLPEQAVAESMLSALASAVGSGQRVLLARAATARDLLPQGLGAMGARVTIVDAYRTVVARESLSLVTAIFGSNAHVDAIPFTSSSTVTNLLALLESAGIAWPSAVKTFSIGPITSRTLRAHGVEPDGEAARQDVEGLVEALLIGLTARQ